MTKPHLRIVLALVTASALVSVAPVSAAISEPEHSTWASNAARSANLRFAWEWRFPLPGAGAASVDPPTWTRRKPVCPLVDLTSPRNPAGIPGRAGDGYNVYYLAIVERRQIQCPRARKLARRHWIRGSAPPLSWRRRRAWRSKIGSAYIGDFVGERRHVLVEYYAVH